MELPEWYREGNYSERHEAFDAGATAAIDRLAECLGVEDYDMAEGSESWEGDVGGTLFNVLKAAGIYDEYNGAIARHPETQG